MEAAGKSHVATRNELIALAIIALAVLFAIYAFHESEVRPTSSDSSLDADVVHVAAAVGGRVLEILVSENARVATGDLLFQIDPVPYQLAVAQAEADLQLAEAQRSTAVIANDETKNALQNHSLPSVQRTDCGLWQPVATFHSSSWIRPTSPSAIARLR